MPESEYEWVPDEKWKAMVVPGGKCSFPRCEGKAVAVLYRRSRRGERRHRYCGHHLYGRRIIGGVVHIQRRKPHA